MAASLAQRLAALPTPERTAYLESLTDAEAQALANSWQFLARPEQLPPTSAWSVWLILAGRGFGKTRSGAEWAKIKAMQETTRGAVVAPTSTDVRDTCFEGESGLLAVLDGEIANWNSTIAKLTLKNGSQIKGYAAIEPERLRGPQHHWAWCDELAVWRYAAAWDNLQLGLRLGAMPQVCITTTPKPTALVRKLIADPAVVKTGGSTYDNRANLAPTFFDVLARDYEGTRLGRQELYAELLSDTPGALWVQSLIDSLRVITPPGAPERLCISVDPAVTATEVSDETGIFVCAKGDDGDGYVLDDLSGRYSMEGWGRIAVDAMHQYGADEIVAEANNGGDLVELAIKQADPRAPVRLVRAVKSKYARAEPVAQLYEQGRVHHVGTFAQLENEMTSWTREAGWSPNRLDALVWGLTSLMIDQPAYLYYEED